MGQPPMRVTRDELDAWGQAFAATLSPPTVVTLEGDLGSGKTTLVQAIARGLGVVESVTSPTYALVHEYRGADFPVFHLDLYRLAGPHELENLAFDEIVGTGGGIAIIEWPEHAEGRLPPGRRRLRLSHVPNESDQRQLEVLS
jgi:tRNA threonylcarbamoyladenosine biosynthesis protein TsaE